MSQGQTVNIYASPSGSATGNGQTSATPVSIGEAQTVARANLQKPCIIWLAPGIYPQLTLSAPDTRTTTAPLTYQSTTPGAAIFQPEAALNTSNFSAIPDSIVNRIINPTAKTKVKQMSLASFNFPDAAPWPLVFSIDNLRSPKFYKNGEPLPMSRYPGGDSTMAMRQVITKGSANSVPGGSFKYRDGRAKYWLSAINDGGLYLSGNWQYTWQVQAIRTLSVTLADSLIVQSIGISGGIGTQVPSRIPSGTEPYYALNLVEEINAEGQWSYNPRTKMLYMWVPASGTITCAGNAGQPAISVTGVSNTQFIGITVRGGAGNGMELYSCNNMLIAGSHITDCSRNGITITDGSNCIVQSNDIDSVGAGGVIISTSTFASDQYNMKSSGHQVINNHIYSFAREAFEYSAAVNVSNAIGTLVAYNKIHDSPHVGVLFGGNNNVLEYNEVYDVVKQYTDMGAFYRNVSGQAWTSRGNKLFYNFIHDAPLANGIYEDAYSSGDSSAYNIIGNTSLATFDNYGYFNSFANNIYVHDTYPVTSNTEASTDAAYTTSYMLLKNLWNGSAAYKKAYPECVDMVAPSGRNNAYTSRIWPAASGNVFVTNPGVLSGVDDSQLFEQNGTTNASYAQTGPPFTKYGIVFTKGIKISGKLTNASLPFNMDSLRSAGAFGQTGATDWHINRIGLHTDAYRTDVSTTKTAGIDPVITLSVSSTNNFVNPENVNLTATVRIPNASKTLLYQWFTDKGAVLNMPVTKKSSCFDSVVYSLQWGDPGWGTHQLTFYALDTLTWKYASNTVSFTISSTPAAPANTKKTAAADSVSSGTAAVITLPSSNAPAKDSVDAPGPDSVETSVPQCTLFPNPAKNLLHINYIAPAATGNANLVVYDLMGNALLKESVSIQQGPNQWSLPLNGIAAGLYLLAVQDEHGKPISRRFIIQH